MRGWHSHSLISQPQKKKIHCELAVLVFRFSFSTLLFFFCRTDFPRIALSLDVFSVYFFFIFPVECLGHRRKQKARTHSTLNYENKNAPLTHERPKLSSLFQHSKGWPLNNSTRTMT